MAGPLTPGSRMMPMSPQDPTTQLNTFKTYVTLIADSTPGIVALEKKLKAAQELSENFEVVVGHPQYPQFLQEAMRVFLKILQESDASFIGENNTQQLRKLLLEIIHRIPTNESMKPYVKGILTVMFKLLETDNEENVLICLRIIIELHKQFRPVFCVEVQQFLKYVKEIYKKLPNYLQKIFDQRGQIKVRDLTEVNIEVALEETFTITTILTEKKNSENQPISFNLIPKAELSLKVLAELPIIVVLMYQLYKQNVHGDIAEFIPLIMNIIVLQPSQQQKLNASFNKEVFVDFIAAQIKTLSFLAYIIRIYQENINVHSAQLVKGMLGLLTYCPQEVAHLRKELLIAARHILATELRTKFVPCIERLFDETVLIGSGWTTYESLRPLAYSTLADLVHHVRQSLSLNDLALAVNLFSKNVHDESLPCNIQTMSCKLLLNLVECIRAKSDAENGNGRELFTRMLEVFVLKFKTISETQLPYLLNKCRQQETGKTASQSQSNTFTVSSVGGFSQGQPSPPLPASNSASSNAISGVLSTPSTDLKSSGLGVIDVKDECKSAVGLGSMPSTSGLGSAANASGSLGGLGPATPGGITGGSGPLGFSLTMDKEETRSTKAGSQMPSYTVVDCRGLVKTLVSGVKTITWGISSCKSPSMDAVQLQNKQFSSKETLVYIRLVQYALQALDIYTLNVSPLGQMHTRSPPLQSVRSKEEKEVLEHFAGIFIMMSPLTFKEIFATTIEYMVERIHQNYALQIVANSFLANMSTSATFATILVEYLLKHMEEMGSNIDRSNLYLKLFKLVFGSVSLLANENEQMLKPHLHTIVNRSMELARTAKEPFNYFLLLRALFRSIGGGSHDLLYQEFLPLLPNLLQGLNSLQSGLHKQQMKDLFVELCLTVPVRLSSLLPYLPMLMDPLVSALNGSQTLISQGLRTLELCVDNLQPEFLYNHIQPVRAELMQALWKCLHNSPDNIANVAFRVLGKFGGSNRKMLREPQKLNYDDSETIGPCLTIYVQECKTPLMLPVENAIDEAFNVLKSPSSEQFYRQSAWDLVRCFIVASINLDDEQQMMNYFFSHSSFSERDVQLPSTSLYICSDQHLRRVNQQALAAMFVAAANKELANQVSAFMVCVVCHYVMVAVSQQAGMFPLSMDKLNKLTAADPHVIVDAMATVTSSEEDYSVPCNVAFKLMLKTATSILGTKERACQLPLFEYLAEKLSALCYERAWYTKLGGCIAIKFLTENMSLSWVLDHQLIFVKALLFVIMDLTGEVSNGALDMAKSNMDGLLRHCAQPLAEPTDSLSAAQNKSMFDTVHELVRHVTSPNTLVREQVMDVLKMLSEVMSTTITDIMEPHKDVLNEMIPPKKHLLRYQPANAQIGLMEGNAFCTTLEPRLFKMDMNTVEHKLFFHELISLCEADDSLLLKLPCYKSLTNLTQLRKSAMKALSACHYIPEVRNSVFNILYKALNSEKLELQQAAHDCMKRFISGFPIEMSIVHTAMRPLLLMLGDFSNLTLNRIQVLSSLTQLFPNTFNEKLCEQLLAHFKKWLEVAASPQKMGQARIVGQVLSNELKICAAIVEIFHLIPAASQKMIEPLTSTMLKGEKELFIEAGSPFRQPLMKFLLRYPEQAIDLFLSDGKVQDQQWNRFFEWLLRQSDGQPFRAILQSNPNRVMNLTTGPNKNSDLQFLAILIINILVTSDSDWLVKQPPVVSSLLCIWVSPDFHERHRKIDTVDYTVWQETHMLVECLLNYFTHQRNEIELLFHMLRCFTARYLPQFVFFKEFLDETVAQTYSVEWKRKAFFKFVDIFHNSTWTQDLKAKILQYIIIPCFAVSFERDEGERLIGGPPSPDHENPDNVISVFINNVIDPENPFGTSDAVRILLLQLASLLVEQASPHIHDAANKKQGNKLRRLMTFAWPCLLPKACVDPATKYHGHLLLSHIIAKFAIHKRIVLQVFHSLLKAHAVEARVVVRQALEILTPAMPGRMEDGNTMLTHWTKKIIVEEGHTIAQLVHILQLIVQHSKVYYPVRHALIQHIVSSVQKLGLTPNATMEHRRLAVDLSEVIVKWECQRVKEETVDDNATAAAAAAAQAPKATTDINKPIDKQHSDTIVNFLLRLACHANEGTGTPGDLLSRRCVTILKRALSPEVWPNSELKLAWFDKILMTVEGQQPSFNNILTALELLAFLLTVLKKELILPCFKPLQRGIAACMTCPNSRVIRMVHSLLTRLMSIFPTESATSNVASKYEELECLYACVSKVIYEGLTNYEKMTNSSPSQLFSTLMILKAACMNNVCYIDRLITSFMRVLQRMAREHLQPASSSELGNFASELLILSLDLVKNRVGVMSPDMRKAFIGTILIGLIDKTQDNKVMKAIMKMVEDWVKTKTAIAINQSPSLREKAILLVKLSQHVEKRFPEDTELNAQFLDLIYYVYKDESLRNTELTSKLEPAFLAGLRCNQPHIRQKFMEVFDASIRRKLFDRLLYVVSSQNWESMGGHFWIKQCIELVLNTSTAGLSLQNSNPLSLLPSATTVISISDSQDKSSFTMVSRMKEEPMDINIDDDDVDMALSTLSDDQQVDVVTTATTPCNSMVILSNDSDPCRTLRSRIQRQSKFLTECRDIKTVTFLNALVQLCHNSTNLAHDVWIQLFPRCWKILSDRMQASLSNEIGPFICSGSHVVQKDCHPSAIGTFVEAVFHCGLPPIPLKPCVIKYIGKSHNLWHRALLVLEQNVADQALLFRPRLSAAAPPTLTYGDVDPSSLMQQDTLESLCELYAHLKEEDMFTAVWQKRARMSEVSLALSYEQYGFFEQAQTTFERAITKMRADHNINPASAGELPEHRLVEEHWIRCAKELNQWEVLTDYGSAKGNTNPHLVMESAWRLPNYWGVFKDALTQVEQGCPKEMAWKVNMYKGYLAVCNPDDFHINMIERPVEMASNCAIKEWRRLPWIVSQVHVPILQAAQQIMELQESVQINQGLQPANLGRDASIHDMKAIVKTWRNRMPLVSDDYSHWSDILHWRQHHYRSIVTTFEGLGASDPAMANHSMLGVHHSAMATVQYGKIARKHGMTSVCLDMLSSIHQIPSVPIVDCYHKIRQQVKCYMQMSSAMGKNELQEGLDVIESTNLKYFPKEMTSEFCALKGMFLAHIGRSEDANKAFSTAVQVFDTLVKAWALWGDYLENLFTKERNIKTGVDAITCYLHACRNQNEAKTRKYLSRVLWLLTYDDEKLSLAEAVDKYSVGVQPVHWLPWIPQLLTCLVRNEGKLILNLLSKVGSVYPQAVYFPIRTLYLTLKIEQRERCKSGVGEFANRPTASTPGVGTATTPGMESSVGGAGSDPRLSGLLVATSGMPSATAGSLSGLPPSSLPTDGSIEAAALPGPPGASSTTTSMAPLSVMIPGGTASSAAQSAAAAAGGAPAMADIGPIKATTPMWRCSRIMHIQRDMHPTVLSSLEGIVDQMVWFRENWYEEVLRQLRQGLGKCRAVAFENRANVADTTVTPHTLNFICKLVSTFGVGVENSVASVVTSTFSSAASESLARRALATAQDPVFQRMKSQFTTDFDFSVPGSMKLHNLINKLKKWIKILEARIKLLPKSFLIEEKCRFLSNFSLNTAEVELPGEFLLPKHSHYFIRIERFMPKVDIVHKHNAAARRLYIRGHNGKIYPYLIVNDACLMESRREERVLQLLRMLNNFLGRQKETSRRLLHFAVPRVVAVSPQMRLIEDNPSSLSLLDIYKQRCLKRGVEYDAPISRYYERLAAIQARGSQPSHQVLRDILKEVQTNMVPKGLLKEWAISYFPNATDFWTFRKNVANHLAVWGFAEFAFCLTRMNPDMVYLHLDSGFLNVSYYKFDTEDTTGELNANRPVPFRLTPNIAEFLSSIGVTGPLTAAMLVTARCLAYPNYRVSSFLAAILRDEYITWHKKKQEESNPNATLLDADGDTLIQLVTKAIQVITQRIQNLATFEGADSRVSTLVAAANSIDNLCRMDPAWHPWL